MSAAHEAEVSRFNGLVSARHFVFRPEFWSGKRQISIPMPPQLPMMQIIVLLHLGGAEVVPAEPVPAIVAGITDVTIQYDYLESSTHTSNLS